jgi:hypothetical protein
MVFERETILELMSPACNNNKIIFKKLRFKTDSNISNEKCLNVRQRSGEVGLYRI